MWDSTWEGSSSAEGFLDQSSNLDTTSAKKKGQVKRLQNVVPVVVRQIQSCLDEEFNLFGVNVSIACLVGLLRNFEVQSTKASCKIEDSTGCIKGLLWLETDNNSSVLPSVKEGCYVKVFCSIRQQEGEKILMILKMVPVDDCNIITNHLLQMIHARLAIEKMAQNEGSKNIKGATSMMGLFSLSDIPANSSASTSKTSAYHSLNKIQQQIVQILKPVKNQVGVSRDKILKSFTPNQRKEVNEALEFLLNEGHVYTTLDNDHFIATDF